jgi:hypothetical protein
MSRAEEASANDDLWLGARRMKGDDIELLAPGTHDG